MHLRAHVSVRPVVLHLKAPLRGAYMTNYPVPTVDDRYQIRAHSFLIHPPPRA